MFLLDTNVVSELRRPKPNRAVLDWIIDVPAEQLFVSAVTVGEIQAGIEVTRAGYGQGGRAGSLVGEGTGLLRCFVYGCAHFPGVGTPDAPEVRDHGRGRHDRSHSRCSQTHGGHPKLAGLSPTSRRFAKSFRQRIAIAAPGKANPDSSHSPKTLLRSSTFWILSHQPSVPGMVAERLNGEGCGHETGFRYCRCGSSSSEISCRYSSLAGNSLGRFRLASPM